MNKEMTLAEFDALCESAYRLQAEVDDLENQRAAKSQQLQKLKSDLLGCMKEFGHSKYHSKRGLVSIRERYTVSNPASPADKIAFFEHLQSRGLFIDMVSVNHNTLNAYFKSEMEVAEASGDINFKIPGIGDPKLSEQVILLKGKT